MSGSVERVGLHGYSPWPAERLVDHVRRGGDVAELPGDFVVTWEEPGVGPPEARPGRRLGLATSALSAVPYFHATSANGLAWAHGATVFDVLAQLGRTWEWNDRAVLEVGLIGHTLGADTLALGVERVPPASVLRFEAGRLETAASRFWDTPPEGGVASVAEFTGLLQTLVGELSSGRSTAVSLSAGFDSRLNLATLLALGQRPALATMGRDDATDVVVAKRIARDFQLDHRVVRLEPGDYLAHGPEIARLTSGSKTADHWHTALFAHGAGFDPSAVHWAGANGEFVRSYYFDKGALALGLDRLPWPLASTFLSLKNAPFRRLPFRPRDGLLTDPRAAVSAIAGVWRHMRHDGGWELALDDFYARQRVRHFIGNGIALYRSVQETCSPFLDGRFLGLARTLPRAWKLDSRLHRELIAAQVPTLVDYPVSNSDLPMGRVGVPGYWRKASAVTGYSVFREVYQSGPGRELVVDSPHLERFLSRRAREQVVGKALDGVAGLLIALHFAAEQAALLRGPART